ncbi:hypothetical protein K501DRAFT_276216 [Backusella circina FSU 941]|nr:hypothetical protein K501DRAFT_276216 [Backusella circina FSU 941]
MINIKSLLNEVKAVTKATHLATKTFEVINSRPVRMIINNNIAEQKQHIQKDDILDQGYEDLEASLANDTNTVNRTEEHEEHEPPSGTEGVLDLTKKVSIPKKVQEYSLLKKIAQCRNKESVYATIQVIDPFAKGSVLSYIKQTVQKLTTEQNSDCINNPFEIKHQYKSCQTSKSILRMLRNKALINLLYILFQLHEFHTAKFNF